jgi:hypothetical protein
VAESWTVLGSPSQGDGDLVLSLQLRADAAKEHERTTRAAAVGNLVDLLLYHDGGEEPCHCRPMYS